MMRKLAALMIAALAAALVLPAVASAQKVPGRVPMSGGGGGGGFRGGGLIGLGVGVATGIIASQPTAGREPAEEPKPKRQSASRNSRGGGGGGGGGSGVPPSGERRMVPDEVVITLSNTVSPQTITAIQTRFRLTQLESQQIALLNATVYRWRIPDRRSVATVVRALEGDNRVAFAQPNYLFALQQTPAEAKTDAAAAMPPRYGDPAQYALAKMRLQDAHRIAKGDEVRVAVIDSGIDPDQPELAGALAGSFDTLTSPFAPHSHGTAIAALIAAHSRLMGSAPGARILGVRAFDPAGGGAEATTFNIVRGLDWSVAQNARIINMSFAGPSDPMIHRALEAASKKGIVLIAAAGNAGEKSPPLYPAAEPAVIAVTATDSSDNLFKGSNRGRHIAVAAPGVDILIAVPNGGYEISTGTSYSAAEVSGIAALMLQRKGDLTPAAVREVLLKTAKDLGKKGRDDDFGAGLADAYRAVSELPGALVSDAVRAK
jgi:subtilisin family serine protease